MNYSEICRLCLIKSSKVGDELFFPIDEAFEKKFSEITNSLLSNNDNYPKTTCITCLSEFEKHYNYRNALIEKQNRLDLLLSVKEEKIYDEELQIEELIEESSSDVEEIAEEHSPVIDLDGEKSNFEESFHENQDIYEMDQEEEFIQQVVDEEEMKPEEEMEPNEEDEKFYKEFYLKDETDDENYVIIEETPKTAAVKQKRKYVKQSSATIKQYKCWIDHCDATFSFRATMRKHMLSFHMIECDKSTCMICGKRFGVYSDFLAHVKIHTRKAECDICKLRFVNDEKMQAHRERVHANDSLDRCFPCEHCNALFKRREHVNSHILYKHTSDKEARRFHCKECSSSFLTRQDMKNHEKSHQKVMIKCCYCEYNCRDLKSIRRHCEKQHKTNKIYKCDCSEYFELHRDLQMHKKCCGGIADSTTTEIF